MSSYRFDLDTALAAWRRSLAHNRTFTADDLDELEQHLRDQVAGLVAQGLAEETAFRQSLREMGDYGTAEVEYRKVYWGKRRMRGELRNEFTWRIAMLKNYLKIAVRTLARQKGYAFINIAGLAVGLACAILIGLFIRFELSFDRFHEKADRIFRIAKENPGGSYLGTNHYAVTPAPLAPALMDEFPEVEHAVQVRPVEVLLLHEDGRFYEDGLYATSPFFDVFSFRLLQGNSQTALAEPNAILLTASLAQKYFGETDPIGQTLSYVYREEEGLLTVTGVVADPPPNSHLQFNFLLSMTSSSQFRDNIETDQWDSSSYHTYASLRPDFDLATFETKLVALAKKNLSTLNYYQNNPDRISIYYPQALTDIHLRSHINFEAGPGGDIRYVYLFSAIGLLILLIACVNYMNLATARSTKRAKEVGVRKVLGAYRRQLVGQFLGEALLLTVGALALAALLAILLLPVLSALTARDLTLGWAQQAGFWFVALGIGLGIGLLAGSYPAFVLSRFDPVGVMKGVLGHRIGRPTLRNVLVIGQFAITAMLIIGTLVVYRQLDYLRTTDTGLDRAQVVSISLEDKAASEQYAALKAALETHPNVLGVTASWDDPIQIRNQSGATSWEGAEEGQRISVYFTPIQPGFLDVLGIELVQGTDFMDAPLPAEREAMLINETFARQLGWEHPIGKWFDFRGRAFIIIGVMRDFNFQSFRQEMAPFALFQDASLQRVLVKVHPEGMQETLAHLEDTYTAFSPTLPFEYEFLDDAYNQMYQTEVRLGSLFTSLTGLALLIACLGLLGLAAFTTAQRTKEIGVRKVLGASVPSIIGLLSLDFLKLIAMAFVVALPLAYIAMQRWLADFAYRVELGPGVFLLAGGLVLLIALATVSYQAVRAALADPVESLHYE